MADIFISYSHEDRDKARHLASLLKGSGYTVWWDETLEAGGDFSEVILAELQKAQAVIVLWTKSSTHSAFVYAEALAASHAGKVVPIRANDINYEQIRPPFNALHTVLLDDQEAIITSVERQLTKPRSAFTWIYQFRFQLLTWLGVFGTAMTILHSLDALVVLSSWAKNIVRNWANLNVAFWSFIPKYVFDFTIPPGVAGYLSTFVFIVSLSASSLFGVNFRRNPLPLVRGRQRGELSGLTRFAIASLFALSLISFLAPYLHTSELIIILIIFIPFSFFVVNAIEAGQIWIKYMRNFPPYRPRHEKPVVLRHPFFGLLVMGGFILNLFFLLSMFAIIFVPVLITERLSYEERVRARIVNAIILVILVLTLSYAHEGLLRIKEMVLPA
jgi:TIR domain